jgi:hypothetical protein
MALKCCPAMVVTVLPSHTPLRSRTIERLCGEPLNPGEELCEHHRAEQAELSRRIARRNAQKLQDYMKGKARAKTDV